jgi:hypothetical protein
LSLEVPEYHGANSSICYAQLISYVNCADPPSFLSRDRSFFDFIRSFHLWSLLLLQYGLFYDVLAHCPLHSLYITVFFFEAQNTSRNHVHPFKEQLPGCFGFLFACCAMPSQGLPKHNSSLFIDSVNNSSFSDSFSDRCSPQCYRPRLFPPTSQRSFVGRRSFDSVLVKSTMLSSCRHPASFCRSSYIRPSYWSNQYLSSSGF